MAAVVGAIDDSASHAAVRAERACLAALAGGCLAPVGAWARFEGSLLHLGACVLGPNGEGVATIVTRAIANAAEMPEELGRRVAEDLRRQGADDMLALGREAEALRRQG